MKGLYSWITQGPRTRHHLYVSRAFFTSFSLHFPFFKRWNLLGLQRVLDSRATLRMHKAVQRWTTLVCELGICRLHAVDAVLILNCELLFRKICI